MTMQIVEKSGEGLSRVYGVTVPAADLNERLEARIREISPQINLKGFRPGKVPVAHVRKMYGKGIMQEIVEQTISDSQAQTLEQNKLRPAASPDFTLASDINAVMDGKADLAFDLAVEIMPEFEPVAVDGLELTRPTYEPTEAEVDEQLTELASQNRTYEAKDAAAADGDMVVADFLGRIDGTAFEGGAGEDAEIVIGSNRFIPGFEEQLIGAKAGDVVTIKVSFPDDYPVDTLKGKPAEFETTIKEVKAPADTAADDAFAERLGLQNLQALKDALKAQLSMQYDQASRYKLKRALLDVLDSRHDFPLPPRMVEGEFDAIWRQVEADRAGGELSEEDAGKSDDELKGDYRKIAERRVRLGLVLAEIGRLNGVTVTDSELNQAINAEARRYPGQEQQVFDAYRQRPDLQAALRAPIYEEKVVDLIVSKAKVADKPVSKDELFAEDDLPDGYGEEDAKPAKKAAPKKAKAEPAAEAAESAAEKPAKKAKAVAAEEPAAEKPKKAPAKKKAE
ncbi:MAG: trigger factor [Caulobacterales bacterium 32-69-10]|nr:MAG: trigger factor [Caulobacterales bacterium 32-69-10]